MTVEQELSKEIKEIWGELGRDIKKLKLKKKSKKELEKGLEALKAVRMCFKLIYGEDSNPELGLRLLANVFIKKEDE